MLRREFGVTDKELLDEWDFWQAVGFMEAASDLLEAINAPPDAPSRVNPDAHVVDARKRVSVDQLKMLGFSVAEEGGGE